MTGLSDPWSLTQRERELVAGLVEHGSAKGAGLAVGRSHRSTCNSLRRAFKKMKVSNDVQAALAWERWTVRAAYVQGTAK